MEKLESILAGMADLLWGNWLLFALIGVGVLYTFATGFVQVRRIPFIVRELFGSHKRKAKLNSLSSTQALSTAIASCVGSGNIIGVATAIIAGGPGSLFWMWFAAFWGMATKFGEIVLGQIYRVRGKNRMPMGGPMYYIAGGLGKPWLGALVAVLLFIQNAGATLIQSNTIASVAKDWYGANPLIVGLVLAALISVIVFGGLKRLAKVSVRIVPIMAGAYLLGGLLVIVTHYDRIPAVLEAIFEGAFTLEAGGGGAAGYAVSRAMRYGVARGLYSNEAGEGSAAVFHSSAEVDHPVRQGVYGVVEVFVDTMLICSMTGFVLLVSGVAYRQGSPAVLAVEAFATVSPWLGHLVPISLFLFAGTSLMNQWYFGHVSLTYLKTEKGAKLYRVLFPLAIVAGCLSTVRLVWSIQDCALGLLIIPNLFALVLLCPLVRKKTLEFFASDNTHADFTKEFSQ